MYQLTKLVNDTWFSFSIGANMFAMDLLHEHGSGFILDLSNDEDFEEFEELIKFFKREIEIASLENLSHNLELEWNLIDNINVKQKSSMITEPYQNPIDVYTQEDAVIISEFLESVIQKTKGI